MILAAAPPALWRPVAGLAGSAAYAASVYGALVVLRRLVASTVVPGTGAGPYCTTPYSVGGALLTVGAVLNPVSPWFILTSGAATGFGAMFGLLLLPAWVRVARADALASELPIGWAWVTAGAAAVAMFIGVFGPGVRLAS